LTDTLANPTQTEPGPAEKEIAVAQAHYRSRRAWPAFRIAERNEPWTRFDDRIAERLIRVRERLAIGGITRRALSLLVAATAFLPTSIAIHTLERLDQDGALIDAALSLEDNTFSCVLHARLQFLWRMQMLSRIFSPERRQLVIEALAAANVHQDETDE